MLTVRAASAALLLVALIILTGAAAGLSLAERLEARTEALHCERWAGRFGDDPCGQE